MPILFAEATPAVTLGSDWYSPITAVVGANAPTLLIGFVAILAISAGLTWVMKMARKATKG